MIPVPTKEQVIHQIKAYHAPISKSEISSWPLGKQLAMMHPLDREDYMYAAKLIKK